MLGLEALSAVRVQFLAERGWGERAALSASFEERDRALRGFKGADETVLWFEHDLYDQLQLIQILSFIAGAKRADDRVSLVCIDRHESVEAFRGLGDLRPHHVGPLFEARQPVTGRQFSVATNAWRAFTSPTPEPLDEFQRSDSSALPFLRPALIRHLQEYPSTFNGLGRTARHALEAIAEGITSPVELLKAHWDQEEAPFMGDWSYWHLLKELAVCTSPLIVLSGHTGPNDLSGATLHITDAGRQVLAGAADAVQLCGIDHWYGGVQLSGHDVSWRWNEVHKRLVRA